jgi:hypothetical protein
LRGRSEIRICFALCAQDLKWCISMVIMDNQAATGLRDPLGFSPRQLRVSSRVSKEDSKRRPAHMVPYQWGPRVAGPGRSRVSVHFLIISSRPFGGERFREFRNVAVRSYRITRKSRGANNNTFPWPQSLVVEGRESFKYRFIVLFLFALRVRGSRKILQNQVVPPSARSWAKRHRRRSAGENNQVPNCRNAFFNSQTNIAQPESPKSQEALGRNPLLPPPPFPKTT